MHFKKTRLDSQIKVQEIEELAASRAGDIAIYENPVSYPLRNGEAGYDFLGGLIDSKTLQLIKEAVLIRHGKICQGMPGSNYNCDDITGLPKTDCTFLYGGILLNNFGHFLLESIGRLWAYNLFKKFDPYILFYAPWGIPDYLKKDNYVHQVLKGFGIPLKRLVFFTEIMQLSRVIIPENKYGFGTCRTPDSTFMNFIKSFYFPESLPGMIRNGDKIYVSRSCLPYSQGRPLGEPQFEKYLEANGYLVVYPEKYTFYQQLTIFKRAKKIIFCDGGAVYCGVFLPGLNAEVAIVARRRDPRWNYKEAVAEHFLGYQKSVLWIDEVTGQYQFGLESWDAVGEIDWYKVSLILKKENFVETTFQGLDNISNSDIKRKELQQFIQSIHAKTLFLDYMAELKVQYPVPPASF